MSTTLGWVNIGLSGLGALLAFALTLVVLGASRERRSNRLLAAILGLQSALQVTLLVQLLRPALTLSVPYLLALDVLLVAIAATLLLFCGTVNTSWTRFLRARPGRAAVVLGAAAVAAVDPILVARGATPETEALGGAAWTALGLASIVALVFSAHAFATTPRGTVAHRRALWYTAAFGVRDLALGISILVWGAAASGWLPLASQAYAETVSIVGLLLFTPLLAYGILSTQLFDIDLRVKWGIRSGTVASILVGGFFAVYKVTEFYLGREMGYIFGGVLSGVFFFLAPRLNKFADNVANKAMPKVQPTSEYVSYKKLEVYRAAVESTLEGDGEITSAERAMLDRLRAKLGLSPEDAKAMESELVPASAEAAPAPGA